ncbi:MAG: SDR family NAD(P)-dependent oxidoreductase [Byssovorax sp.]
MLLAEKRVVVTGARRGIGRAIALAAARDGAIVGINVRRDDDEAQALAAEILAAGAPEPVILPFDVTDPAAIDVAIATFTARHGHIDGWVNNAAENRPSLLATADDARIRAQIETNLLGPIFATRAVLPVMMARRAGVILNVSSVAAVRPVRGQSIYAATKGGLEAFTRAVAVEYGKKGIRALCLRPGAVDTAMLAATKALGEDEILGRIPLKRIATPAEIADVAVFLLSDRARYLTGSEHAADGGYLGS